MYDAPHMSQFYTSSASLFLNLYNCLIGYIISERTCESMENKPIGFEPIRSAPMRSEPIESDET